MDDKMMPNENDAEMEDGVYTLTDENGQEQQFALLATAEIDGVTYYAFAPQDSLDSEEGGEYVVLKAVDGEDDDMVLVSVDDDEEFDKAADYFDDLLNEIDYDAE